MISKETAEHFVWKEVCDGWHLVKGEHLSVIQERMPPGTAEDRHFHHHVKQFFFVLSGEATFELDGKTEKLETFQGIEVPPGAPHLIRNESGFDIEFLVISSGLPRNDRHPA